MPVKVQVPQGSGIVRFFLHPVGKTIVAVIVATITLGLVFFTYYYVKYSKLIEAKLAAGPFANTSMLFAAPRSIAVGEQTTPQELASELRHAGYSEATGNRMGHYDVGPEEIDIYPGPDSFFKRQDGVIKFSKAKVTKIISLADNSELTEYTLEPELISNLFDKNREKRRLVRYDEIPPVLIHAVISAEDKRFFQHSGFDPVRVVKSAYIDLKARHNAQGASTLSMQLAGMLFLDRSDRTWSRKVPELLITLHLEQKLTKQKIFEYYANQVPLGHRGSFGIRGFGEAAQVYFGKDLSHLTVAEAATIAGLIQQPSYSNPFRWPERARTRRNIVLKMMRDNKYIDDNAYEAAAESPLALAKHSTESTDAPYFVDLVNDTLLDKFQDYDFQTTTYRIYTTLDLQLQRDAAESVRIGMEEVDKQLKPRKKKDPNYPDPQCALVALDPQTGQVLAIIGGRNYGTSQLDRVLAKRQPGSSFKPFVYAAALNTGLNGASTVLTPATVLQDEPTTFLFNGKPYQPGNFHHELFGPVTMRKAIAHSLNIPTVQLAQQTGYGAVVEVARRAGLLDIQPTPALALGSYEVTPLDIAGGYTIFANRGMFAKPYYIASIGDQHGGVIFESKPQKKQAIDPRVAFLMDSLLEEVLRSGTGAGVHSRGINFPAAGKTGTSHDGWFAGFTNKLICVVWVGFDDNRELNLEGAKSALYIWAEFMKRAHEHRQYRNVSSFTAPAGIVSAQIDPESGLLATANCPAVRTEFFIAGTEPVEACSLHGGGGTRVAGWDATPAAPGSPNSPNPSSEGKPNQKKGLFGKIREIFR